MGNCDAAPVAGGVNFSGNLAQLYDANLNLRTASRIVVRVDEFHASSFHELERRAKRIRWDEYLKPGARVQFRVTCRKSGLYHSDAVAQRFSEAVAKQVQGVVIGAAAAGSADDSDVAVSAARAFRALVADGRTRELVLRKVDGDDIAVSWFRPFLVEAGFVAGYRGLVLRADRPAGP